jgi:hypothetical protein
MTMDDNYIMAENMRQLAEEAPSLHRQINVLRRKLDIAIKALNIYAEGNPSVSIASDALDEIDEIK